MLNGSLYQMRWDDEDRLVGETTPSGVVDTFTYNGLGLRVGKTDSTGSYFYVCDGASPNAPVLSDGHALYTPGLSQNRAGVSSYDSHDLLGNLWFVDTTGANQTYYQDTSAFGAPFGISGTDLSPFKFGGGNGSQTDTDIGFVLMGHRYYDSRQGRFISQDPAGDGDNWYAYADNSPTNEIDPEGFMLEDGPGSQPSGTDMSVAMGIGNIENFTGTSLSSLGHWTNGVGTLSLGVVKIMLISMRIILAGFLQPIQASMALRRTCN